MKEKYFQKISSKYRCIPNGKKYNFGDKINISKNANNSTVFLKFEKDKAFMSSDLDEKLLIECNLDSKELINANLIITYLPNSFERAYNKKYKHPHTKKLYFSSDKKFKLEYKTSIKNGLNLIEFIVPYEIVYLIDCIELEIQPSDEKDSTLQINRMDFTKK